jgi:hypothetical protein
MVVSSAGTGFYLGGRYVGAIAQPTYTMGKPAWIQTAQQTMWIALALGIVSVVAWMILDYREIDE